MQKTFVLTKWKAPPPPDRMTTVPQHRIAVTARPEDYECILLATMGKYTLKTIAKITHLTVGQVAARLRAGGVKMSELREGKGPYAALERSALTRERAQGVQLILREQVSQKLLKSSE